VAFVAFLAFRTEGGLWKCTPATDTSFGVATLANAKTGEDVPPKNRMKKIKAIVARARSMADVVVVWLHWGTERRTVPDPFQVQLGRAFVEAGADCVLGSHPHVLQGGEIYAGRPIFYSLGNLVSPLPATTAVFWLTFEGRKFVKSRMLPCRIGSGRVEPIKVEDRPNARAAFLKLGQAVTTKFRNSRSKAMAPG
jgi:poly-gamma-glutamate synthesis protein (capsule biosynthesis protein)